MVDRELMLRKLADLETLAKQAAEFAVVGIEEYRKDWKTQRIVERTMQLAIEVCVDVANHIISDRGFRIPVSYADGFRSLSENGIIDENLCGRLTRMCGFRNILVHDYTKIDPAIVLSILRENLQDFERFKTIVVQYLDA